ncbi:MAG: fibronectin type III domain-containing protein [Deltaproteobacteria bacterium]|nr:fibronectin type III domain-containing protein [Deltaproteobacteria bacterium]
MRTSLRPFLIIAFGFATTCSSETASTTPPADAGTKTDAGVDAGTVADAGTGSDAGSWTASVTAAKTGGTIIDGGAIYSSTKLLIGWSATSQAIDHFAITASESIGGTVTTASADAGVMNATLMGLKSGTTYAIAVAACVNAGCTTMLAATGADASATTEQEFYRMVGSGNTMSGWDAGVWAVPDGMTLSHVFRYGADAGASLEGKLQMAYNVDPAIGGYGKGLWGARLATIPTAADAGSLYPFTPFGGSYMLSNPDAGGTSDVAAYNAIGMPVPLGGTLGAKIRLFLEGTGSDGRSRILSLDSTDGYEGKDFHGGSATVCLTNADYSGDGGCALTRVIKVEADDAGNTNLRDARQFKIGYPTMTDWRWNGEPGTFMVFTVDLINEGPCGIVGSDFTSGYAVYDGIKWDVQYDGGTCPKLFRNVRVPNPVHLGAATYKMYFTDDRDGGNQQKRVAYAHAGRTGNPAYVDFEDWEDTVTEARDVNFLWPDGTLMASDYERPMDDFSFLMPTNDVNFQVMYSNFGMPMPHIAVLILVNP